MIDTATKTPRTKEITTIDNIQKDIFILNNEINLNDDTMKKLRNRDTLNEVNRIYLISLLDAQKNLVIAEKEDLKDMLNE